jgi:hypothetical protein
MGSTVKPKAAEVYGALLYAYPQSFRKHYSQTMVQTFDDMLQGEPTRTGRWRIWVRTLFDLPISAAKEHVTNGKELNMNQTSKIILGVAIAAILFVGAGSFWFGRLHALQSVGVERVGVAQLADAMQQDHFYSDYGSAALLFSAKVSAVTHHNNVALVTFVTAGRPYSVTCQFTAGASIKVGQVLSVAAPGGSADREPHGVLLHNCLND